MFEKIQNFLGTTVQTMGSLVGINTRRAVNALQGAFGVSDTDRVMRELQQPIEQKYSQYFAHLGAKSIADYKKGAQALAKEWGDVQSEDAAKRAQLKTDIFAAEFREYMYNKRPTPQWLSTVKSILAELDFEVIEDKQKLWLKTEVKTRESGLLDKFVNADPAVIDAFTKKLLGDRSGLTN